MKERRKQSLHLEATSNTSLSSLTSTLVAIHFEPQIPTVRPRPSKVVAVGRPGLLLLADRNDSTDRDRPIVGGIDRSARGRPAGRADCCCPTNGASWES